MDDHFYRAFEERFRGPRGLIKRRLAVYLDFVHALRRTLPGGAALDLGCGRGEWLEFLRDRGIAARGVDLNDAMLAACTQAGLDVANGNALDALLAAPDESLALVSAFHLVEHLEHGEVRGLLAQAHRALKPGGLLILETPNPENLIVAGTTFHLDPTHRQPLPPMLLQFLCEYAGFERHAILRLQPPVPSAMRFQRSLRQVLNGVSPDYAVVARKAGPGAELFEFAFTRRHGPNLDELLVRYDAATPLVRLRQDLRARRRRIRAALRVAVYRGYLAWLGVETAARRGIALLRTWRRQQLRPRLKRWRNALRARIGIAQKPPRELPRLLPPPESTALPDAARAPRLFLDLSLIIRLDYRTGIQRVVRSIVQEWLRCPPPGYRIELVYGWDDEPYRCARQTADQTLDGVKPAAADPPLDARAGDVFLGLDLCGDAVIAHRDYFRELRRRGVAVHFVVYDLLPITFPQHFHDRVSRVHHDWLQVVAENDGAICISQAVAGELERWMHDQTKGGVRRARVRWFHLGADIHASLPSRGYPPGAEALLATMASRPCFLMVGTLEPRKGHRQVLDAFDRLWQRGRAVNLVIIGREGWSVRSLVRRLKRHPERGQRLFWLDGASDQFLEDIYSASTCLIAASDGEGFGLPLIEAAQHGLPILARDLPVFREVAGEHASYFQAPAAGELAASIENWIAAYDLDQAPSPTGMPRLNWKQSAEALCAALLD